MPYKKIKCNKCGKEVERWHNAKFCEGCLPERQKERKRKHWYSGKGKKTSREYSRRYRARDGGKSHATYMRKYNAKKREQALDILGRKCQRCGYDEFECSLDIHHFKGKDSTRDWMRNNFDGWDDLRILCRNCHQALHNGEWSL